MNAPALSCDFTTAISRPQRADTGHYPLLALFCLIAMAQPMLWRFLGLSILAQSVGLVALAAAVFLFSRAIKTSPLALRPLDGKVLIIGLAVAATVFVLGSEGRLFYAHTDWQVRRAVLGDLARFQWPFAYEVDGGPHFLRAPIGLYLSPASIGKLIGHDAQEWAMLAQNTALFGCVIALGARLFDRPRTRWLALFMFLGFSGMDVIGQLLDHQPLTLDSERWNVAIFTAHLTQAFGVPQHALAGWIGALLYLLWRDGKLPLVGFLAPLPLLPLWSPLAVMGLIPFAAHAGIETLRHRALRPRDIALPALTTLIALPGLVYLASGSSAVGGGAIALTPSQYLIFEALEVAPYLLALVFIGWRGLFGGATFVIAAAVLLVSPFIQVGQSGDFVMRASIPALAILSLALADTLARPALSEERLWRTVACGAFAIGVFTPACAIYRAVAYPPAPRVLCSYFGVVPHGFSTYVTPLDAVSPLVRPAAPALIHPHDPSPCWSGPWPDPLEEFFRVHDVGKP